MIQTEKIELNGKQLDGVSIKTENAVVLLIKAAKGMLCCGYFNVEAADKLGDAMAVVTGVASFDDMMDSAVVKASGKAKELGINEGMTGKEALGKMV